MIKVLDATLRETCHSIMTLGEDSLTDCARDLARCGLNAVEVGYLMPALWGTGKPAACSPPAFLRQMKSALGRRRMSVLTHFHNIRPGDLDPIADLGIGLLRIGVRSGESSVLRARAVELRRCGVPFSINAIRVSEQRSDAIIELARIAEGEGAEMFYIADSNGSFFPTELKKLGQHLSAELSIPLGVHLHDNLSLAFANALTALKVGFTWLDGTLAGAGKGGGNLSTERILLHLATISGRPVDLEVLSRLSWEWSQRSHTDRFWSAVFGTLNLNQDQARTLMQLSQTERLQFCSTQLYPQTEENADHEQPDPIPATRLHRTARRHDRQAAEDDQPPLPARPLR